MTKLPIATGHAVGPQGGFRFCRRSREPFFMNRAYPQDAQQHGVAEDQKLESCAVDASRTSTRLPCECRHLCAGVQTHAVFDGVRLKVHHFIG